MSKHETSNQFKDGLMMDVHPLQTPNTVLTDCLNGTFITYNGNEHVLQNDMGNFKLSKCKLKENYIPIGTTSYGDVLYIASYNPIEKTFELGSYPSPLFWGSSNKENILPLTSVIEDYLGWIDQNQIEDNKRLNWLDLAGHSQSIIFDGPEFKLCPGDKYSLTESGEYGYRLETTNYYILDENQVKHAITPQLGNTPVSVDWETPGYLGIEKTVMTPFEHKVSLKKAIVGNNSVSYDISSILTIQDENLCNILEDIAEDFIFEISTNISSEIIKVSPKQNQDDDESYVKCNSQVYQWLGEKKQLISEYTITISYGEGGLWEDDEFGGKTYKSVETVLTITPTIVDRNITIIFDNLQQSVTYTANGNNITSAATQYFTWNRVEKEGNYEWEIKFDQFFASEGDTITCQYGDIYNLTGYEEEDTTADRTITVSDNWSDKLLYLVITITSEQGFVRKIGRFAF